MKNSRQPRSLKPKLSAFAANDDTRVFEMRTYYAAPGKLDALNARFRDHTCKLFEKHGMTNIGYWMNRKLVWDLAKERFENDDEANGWLSREPRAKWKV